MNTHWELKQKKVESYVWYDNLFNDDELKQIQVQSTKKDYSIVNKTGLGAENRVDKKYRHSDTYFLNSDNTHNHWIFERISNLVHQANKEWYNFELDHLENLQYTIYKSKQKQFYKAHVDTILNHFDNNVRKLSFSLLLNDDFNGGDLNFYYTSEPMTVEKKKGRIYFFPSYVLHEVSPVTKGTRNSLVGWVKGPHFV
jgi:PKHD-type hydroxylase